MKYAYIFDFDGVLVNTMETHFACYKKALAEVNVPVDKKQFFSQAGMTGKEQIMYFAEKAGVAVDPEKVYARTREIRKEVQAKITAVESNLELLTTLRQNGYKVAIATGSSRASVLPVMNMFGIKVDSMATSEDINRGKPFPDLFLCAAKKMNIPPERCIVVEDSDAGIDAARAAGMKAMRFYDNGNSKDGEQ